MNGIVLEKKLDRDFALIIEMKWKGGLRRLRIKLFGYQFEEFYFCLFKEIFTGNQGNSSGFLLLKYMFDIMNKVHT